MWFGIITLFPEMIRLLDHGITGRAVREGLIQVTAWNPRELTSDPYRRIDDRPYGGGPGMVMLPEPLLKTINRAKKAAPKSPWVIHLTPQGRVFDQNAAMRLLKRESILFIAGRYEGIDERLVQLAVDEEWSIGDYVLTGGELAAFVMIDAITRLIPGALGDESSAEKDSFSAGLLEYPQYTRPVDFCGLKVPDVLLSGHHADIERWRLKQSLGRTWLKRPDLLKKLELNEFQLSLLNEFKGEEKQ